MHNLIIFSGFAFAALRFPDSRVVGGKEVRPPFKYPFMASLLKFGEHHCGGTHVAEGVVLTAAHCTNSNDKYFEVLLHRHDFAKEDQDENAVRLPVLSRIIHPDYIGRTYQNDISIWRFKGGPKPQPILLDDGNLSSVVGTPLTVAGWGYTQPGGRLSDILMEAKVPVYDPDRCVTNQKIKNDTVFLDVQFCAGLPEGGRDACQADSGGPLFTFQSTTPVLVGIVSWGNGCAERNLPGVYTKISALAPWIRSHVTI